MKVLQVHNQYRVYGGEDAVMDLEADLLREHGHEVEQFTVTNKSVKRITVRTGLETIWSQRSKEIVSDVVDEVSPDLIHVHNTFPILSPSIYWATSEIPMVQTLHNYRLACLNASLLRDNRPCQDCVGLKFPLPGLRHRCYRGSLAASGAVATMQMMHKALGTFKNRVDAYVVLTDFAKSVMVRSGLPQEIVHVKPNFVLNPKSALRSDGLGSPKRISYVGRLSYEKGVDLLLDAWEGKSELTIIGDGPERARLHDLAGTSPTIDWQGWLPKDEIMSQIRASKFIVLPSRLYEGFPMVIVEALAAGTPVIAPNHGGFPDVITEGETGFLFKPNDRDSLAEKLEQAITLSKSEWQRMRENTRKVYLERYTPETNYEILRKIYQSAFDNSVRKARS